MGLPSTPAFKKEALRKLFHLPGLLFLYGGAYQPRLCAALLGLLIGLYLLSWILVKKGGRGIPFFEFLTRYFERNGSLDLGPVFLALGLAICLLFFDFRLASFGIFQICLADGAASLAGMVLGKKRIFYSPRKTYVGSFAFFIVAFLAHLPFAPPTLCAFLAGTGMVLESLPLRAWDNLIVPVGVSLLASLLI